MIKAAVDIRVHISLWVYLAISLGCVTGVRTGLSFDRHGRVEPDNDEQVVRQPGPQPGRAPAASRLFAGSSCRVCSGASLWALISFSGTDDSGPPSPRSLRSQGCIALVPKPPLSVLVSLGEDRLPALGTVHHQQSSRVRPGSLCFCVPWREGFFIVT